MHLTLTSKNTPKHQTLEIKLLNHPFCNNNCMNITHLMLRKQKNMQQIKHQTLKVAQTNTNTYQNISYQHTN